MPYVSIAGQIIGIMVHEIVDIGVGYLLAPFRAHPPCVACNVYSVTQ